MLRSKKKIHTRNLITKKNSCGSKIPHPPPPHNFFNGPSLSLLNLWEVAFLIINKGDFRKDSRMITHRVHDLFFLFTHCVHDLFFLFISNWPTHHSFFRLSTKILLDFLFFILFSKFYNYIIIQLFISLLIIFLVSSLLLSLIFFLITHCNRVCFLLKFWQCNTGCQLYCPSIFFLSIQFLFFFV